MSLPFEFTPRWFQAEAVDSLYHYFQHNPIGHPLIALPTGTGKSWIPAMFMEDVLKKFPDQRLMLISHVQELIEQDYEKLELLWPIAPAGICCAGLNRKEIHLPLTFGTVGSMVRIADQIGHIDIIIIDEAHMISPNSETMYRKLIRALQAINPCLRVVGMTATYYRMGSGMLTDPGGLFTDICYNKCDAESFLRFIAEGYLCPLVPRDTKEHVTGDGVKTVAGDYGKKALDLAVNTPEKIAKIVPEIMEKGANRRNWLTFCTSIDHANKMAEALTDAGMRTIAIHNKLSKKARRAAISDFKAGRVHSLTNKDMLTTGHDFPALDLINMLRPTKSAALWVQMLGRGTRPSVGKKDCLVLDFAGNTARLGPINDPVMPSKRKKRGKQEAPVKVCEACLAYCHASARECNHCGEEFKFIASEEKLDEKAGTKALVKATLMPEVVDLKLDEVKYFWFRPPHTDAQRKKGKGRSSPCLVVRYIAGFHTYEERFYLEANKPWARSAAYKWWESMSTGEHPVPKSVDKAIHLIRNGALKELTHIRVWVNKQPKPDIINYAHDTRRTSTDRNIAEPVGKSRPNEVLSELRTF